MLDYDARVFRSVANSDGGDVDDETTFHYHQHDDIVWATYAGGSVVFGTLLAKADTFGNLDMRYQHLSVDGHFKSEFDSAEAAEAAGRKLKSAYPMLQIEIYDAANMVRTLVS